MPSKITRADIEALSRRPGMPPLASRAGQDQHHHGHNINAQQAQEHLRQQQALFQEQLRKREDAKNRSHKPIDRDLPEGLDDLVIGDGVARYNAMRELERRLDALMTRKRLDVQDSVYKDREQAGTLRIWISNTVDNQPWQYTGMDAGAYDFGSGVEATFRVLIEGRLLDDEESGDKEAPSEPRPVEESDEPAAKRTKLSSDDTGRRRFSHFFKSIAIDFDRPAALQPDGFTRIEWKRPELAGATQLDSLKEADFDRLEFERKADENINVKISLVRADKPERYRLSPPLAELLDLREADRATVLMGIWEYVKLAGIRMDEDKRQIFCDHRLQAETIYFPTLRELVRPHLSDLPPLVLDYTIRVDKAFHMASTSPQYTVYDVAVPLPSALTADLAALTADAGHAATLHQIARTDDDIALVVAKLGQGKAKHDFFTSMSTDPASFLRRWIASQQRDLDIILGAGAWGEDDWQAAEWRRGGTGGAVWDSAAAAEGVGAYLSRQR